MSGFLTASLVHQRFRPDIISRMGFVPAAVNRVHAADVEAGPSPTSHFGLPYTCLVAAGVLCTSIRAEKIGQARFPSGLPCCLLDLRRVVMRSPKAGSQCIARSRSTCI